MNKGSWKAFCSEWGLAETYPPMASLTPVPDIIRTRPTDHAHSEYAGLSKLAHQLLINATFSPDGQRTSFHAPPSSSKPTISATLRLKSIRIPRLH